ncbi:globin family protein [Anabaena azotica]|uniref:Uncharacterized protein n=1 Tax=Anabaena azotica FACHB-119 TaxID=947527 RepID=A0ABR8D297_9NOST|nr:hypothetical protein [Anabaena azotica]MBD2501255.1 hypothetical protein [Anabaena azotica FACHB-119]
MGWDGPVSAIATVGSTLLTFIQWREAKNAKDKNKELETELKDIKLALENNKTRLQEQDLKSESFSNKVKEILKSLKKEVKVLKESSVDSPILKELAEQLEKNIVSFDRDIKELKNQVNHCKEAGIWLEEHKKFLSQEAGAKALEGFPQVREPGGKADTQEELNRFYRTIEVYLHWTANNLKEGQYLPLDKSIPLFLHRHVYIAAFRYIRDHIQELKLNVPDYISNEALVELRKSLDDLIKEIS